MPYLPLSPEQLQKASLKGWKLPNNPVVDADTGDIVEDPMPEMRVAPPVKEPGMLDKLGTLVTDTWNKPSEGGIVGLTGRSIANQAVPASIGGAAGLGTAGILAGLGIGATGGTALIPIGVGAGAAYLASKLQNKATSALAARDPEGMWARREALINKDVTEHPWLTAAMSLPAAKFAGGSLVPSPSAAMRMIKENPKMAAKFAGVMGGADLGLQAVEHPDYIDPIQTAIATVGAPFFAGGRNAPPSSAMAQNDTAGNLAKMQGGGAAKPGTVPVQDSTSRARIAAMERALGEYKAANKTFMALAKEAENSVPGSPEHKMMTQSLAKMRADLEARRLDLFSGLNAEAPELPVGIGLDEVKAPGKLEPIEPNLEAKDVVKDTTTLNESAAGYVPPKAQVASQVEAALGGDYTPNTPLMNMEAPAALTGPKPKVALPKVLPMPMQDRPIRVPTVPKVAPQRITPDTLLELTAQAERGRALPEATQVSRPSTAYTPEQLAEIQARVRAIQSGQPVVNPAELEAALKAGQIKKGSQASEQPPKVESAAPIESRNSGLPAEVVKKAVFAPLDWMRAKLGPVADIVSNNPLLQRLGKTIEGMNVRNTQVANPYFKRLYEMSKGLSPESQERATAYLYDMQDTGTSALKLTPEEANLVKSMRKLIDDMGVEKRDLGPLIDAYDASGNAIRRPVELREGHVPPIKAREVHELLSNPMADEAAYQAMRADYIKHVMEKTNLSEESAAKLFAQQGPKAIGPQAPNARFRSMRYEEGLGLPRSMRTKNLFADFGRYINRHALDMGYYREFESDPVMRAAMGEETYGRDLPIPEDLTIPGTNEKVSKGILSSDAKVRKAMEDYVGFMDETAQNFEKWQSAVHIGRIGPMSQTRNLVQNLGALGEVVGAKEAHTIVQGVKEMFTGAARNRAEAGGGVRYRANVLPTTTQELGNGIRRLLNVYSKYSGAEGIAKSGDVMLDSIGRALVNEKINTGDTAFLDYFGPKDWRSKTLPEIQDYVGATFTRHFSGSYDATQLPAFLLKGSNSGIAPLFKLARWSVGRYNKFYEAAIIPAKNGNIAPLVRSLAGSMISAEIVNELVKALTGVKPKELTWAEWLKLDRPDTAYTIFSKAATASNAGILADLAFGLVQMKEGNLPRTYNNLVYQFATDLIQRSGQFVEAMRTGADITDLGWLALYSVADQSQALKLMLPKEDEGNREEKLARRLGYMPPKASLVKPTLPNPISQAGAYRRGDEGRLARIFKDKMERGEIPEAPANDVRTSKIRVPGGGRRGYYDFIKAAQGEEAAKAALERDRTSTRAKQRMYSSAMRQAVRERKP